MTYYSVVLIHILSFPYSDDVSYVVDFVSYAEQNHWFGENKLLFAMGAGKTISNRQTKLVLYKSSKLSIIIGSSIITITLRT